jgi:hypothetical protein
VPTEGSCCRVLQTPNKSKGTLILSIRRGVLREDHNLKAVYNYAGLKARVYIHFIIISSYPAHHDH